MALDIIHSPVVAPGTPNFPSTPALVPFSNGPESTLVDEVLLLPSAIEIPISEEPRSHQRVVPEIEVTDPQEPYVNLKDDPPEKSDERLNRDVVESSIKVLGETHPDTLRSMENLADSILENGLHTRSTAKQKASEVEAKVERLRREQQNQSSIAVPPPHDVADEKQAAILNDKLFLRRTKRLEEKQAENLQQIKDFAAEYQWYRLNRYPEADWTEFRQDHVFGWIFLQQNDLKLPRLALLDLGTKGNFICRGLLEDMGLYDRNSLTAAVGDPLSYGKELSVSILGCITLDWTFSKREQTRNSEFAVLDSPSLGIVLGFQLLKDEHVIRSNMSPIRYSSGRPIEDSVFKREVLKIYHHPFLIIWMILAFFLASCIWILGMIGICYCLVASYGGLLTYQLVDFLRGDIENQNGVSNQESAYLDILMYSKDGRTVPYKALMDTGNEVAHMVSRDVVATLKMDTKINSRNPKLARGVLSESLPSSSEGSVELLWKPVAGRSNFLLSFQVFRDLRTQIILETGWLYQNGFISFNAGIIGGLVPWAKQSKEEARLNAAKREEVEKERKEIAERKKAAQLRDAAKRAMEEDFARRLLVSPAPTHSW